MSQNVRDKSITSTLEEAAYYSILITQINYIDSAMKSLKEISNEYTITRAQLIKIQDELNRDVLSLDGMTLQSLFDEIIAELERKKNNVLLFTNDLSSYYQVLKNSLDELN